MYAKLENDSLIYAPNRMSVNGFTIINPTKDQYIDQGWFPVFVTEPPEEKDIPEGKRAVRHWIQAKDNIHTVWLMEDLPPAPPEVVPVPTIDERLQIVEKKQRELEQRQNETEGGVIEIAEMVAGGVMNDQNLS